MILVDSICKYRIDSRHSQGDHSRIAWRRYSPKLDTQWRLIKVFVWTIVDLLSIDSSVKRTRYFRFEDRLVRDLLDKDRKML